MWEIVKAWYLTMCIVGIGLGFFCLVTDPPIIVAGNMDERSIKELKKAHRYHGVLWSYQDEKDGQWYFHRDGHRIKLFCHLKEK